MKIDGTRINLDIAGIGIIIYSPSSAEHIAEGSDYLADHYTSPEQVVAHVQNGTIVGFCTGSPGTFRLNIRTGYPKESHVQSCEFKLRLALRCTCGVVCFRDLYDLMDWCSDCPPEQTIALDDGIYHITLCSDVPESQILGDNQTIDVYLKKLNAFPKLAYQGVPMLCE